MEARELALAIAGAALDKQALSLEIIDVGEKVDYASFLVICSGRSERHVRAVAEGIESALAKRGVHPLGVEGREACRWVLVDYDDVVLHVFEANTRGYYDLEGLWIDAVRVPIRRAASVS